MVREISCDVAIVGAGTAGLSARTAACRAGASTILIDSGPGGTTCARVGCMPSKLLIAAAAAAAGAARLGEFGLRVDGRLHTDGLAVMERVRRERDFFVGSVRDKVSHIPADQTLRGRARFLAPTVLAVDDQVHVAAGAIVLATGSRSVVPAPLRSVEDLVLTNETVFELDDLPESLAVVGAGPLGIELAQAFARLGVRVAVFDRGDTVAGISDPDVAACAREILSRELDLKLGSEIRAARDGDGVRITWTSTDSCNGSATFARVLAAAGRRPVLDSLDLGRTGLLLDHRGVPVFDPTTMRCGDSAVFLAGDVAAGRPVLHEAAFEGEIAGRNAARYPDAEPAERATPLSVVFTAPEIARVGPPFASLRSEQPAVGHADLGRSGRARVMAENAGLIRLYADRTDGRLLGGEMIGPQAEHLAHLLAWLVQLKVTAEAALSLPLLPSDARGELAWCDPRSVRLFRPPADTRSCRQ